MSFRPIYLDTSAIVKLVMREAESGALATELERWPDRVSAVVARVELHRALWRAKAPKGIRARADAVLSRLVLIQIDEPILSRASSFEDAGLRSLDAIHLATSLSMGDDPEAFVTYDVRLARAATRQKLRVRHPGVSRLES